MRNLVKNQVRNAGNSGVEENDTFKVGKNVGITPGKVICQDELMELIQYQPTTPVLTITWSTA